MATASRDVSLTDVLALLSTVSAKLNQKADNTREKISKTTGNKEDKSNTGVIDAIKKLSGRPTAPDKKVPAEVVEEAKPVTILSFGKTALQQLLSGKKEEKKEKKPTEEKKDDGIFGWVKKLVGPALLVLGGIAAFVTGLFSSGPLKGVMTMIGKLGIKGGLLIMAKQLGKFLGGKVLRKIPIIGTILGLMDAWTRFKSDDFVGGTIALVSSLVSLIDLVAPGVGSALSLGLDMLNSVLDAGATGKTPKERTSQKLAMLDQWADKITKFLLDIPIIQNFAQFGQGVGDILAGNFKEGFLNMAYALPFFGTLLGFIGLPKNVEEASEDIGNISDMMNKAMQPIYKSIIGILPSWMQDLITIGSDGNMTFTPGKMFDNIAKRVGSIVGIVDNTKGNQEAKAAENAAKAKFKEEHDRVMKEMADPNITPERKDELTKKKKETEQGYKKYNMKSNDIEPHDDFILKPDGKVIEPHKDDTVIGFKPGGAIDINNNKNNSKIADSLKSLQDVSKDLMSEQIEVLLKCQTALEVIAKNIINTQQQTSSNSVISKNSVTNIFPSPSIRDFQSAYSS